MKLLKNIRYKFIIAVIAVIVFSHEILVPMQKEKKKDKKEQERPCCVLGLASYIEQSSVVLEQICKKGSFMTIYFHTKNMAGTCVYPPSTILMDQNGSRYKFISSKGLPDCSTKQLNHEPDIKFSWTFQSFHSGVKRFTLKEVEDEITAGMQFWIWKDVDVSHCRF